MAPQTSGEIRIRILKGDNVLWNKPFELSEDELTKAVVETIFGSERYRPGLLWFSWIRDLHPIKVFIEGSASGAVLTTVTKVITESVCAKIRQNLESRKKKTKVLLYSPEGKEIDWEKKR
jgi:hypothetical protein